MGIELLAFAAGMVAAALIGAVAAGLFLVWLYRGEVEQ